MDAILRAIVIYFFLLIVMRLAGQLVTLHQPDARRLAHLGHVQEPPAGQHVQLAVDLGNAGEEGAAHALVEVGAALAGGAMAQLLVAIAHQAIEQLERAAGTEETVLMWNPPWALPLVLPFGMLDARPAHLLWLLVQFAALAVSADCLWRFFGGAAERRWIAWLIASSTSRGIPVTSLSSPKLSRSKNIALERF